VLQLVEGVGFGGAEKKLLELTKRLDKKKFRIVVCCLGLNERIKKEFEMLGTEVVVLPRGKRLDPCMIFRVVQLIKKERIDIVMTTLFYADIVGSFAGKVAGVKAVLFWETISAPEWLLKRRFWLYRIAVRFCDWVIAVSQATARFVEERRKVPPTKIKIIPYGVDLDLFTVGSGVAVRKELGFADKDPVVGTVARIHPQKGHIYLIQAAERIISKFPNVRFVLVGDGELRSSIENEVMAKHLDNHFFFLGFRSDVARLLESFDIFVLPSLYEGMPNVILEAMGCGKPVVATSVDGSKEVVIDGETGLLVPPKNPERLAEAISYLLENRRVAEEFGRRGRERVATFFSLEKQIERFEKLYQHLSEVSD